METTTEDVKNSLVYADEVSKLRGLPVVMTCAMDSICGEGLDTVPNLFPLSLQKKII